MWRHGKHHYYADVVQTSENFRDIINLLNRRFVRFGHKRIRCNINVNIDDEQAEETPEQTKKRQKRQKKQTKEKQKAGLAPKRCDVKPHAKIPRDTEMEITNVHLVAPWIELRGPSPPTTWFWGRKYYKEKKQWIAV